MAGFFGFGGFPSFGTVGGGYYGRPVMSPVASVGMPGPGSIYGSMPSVPSVFSQTPSRSLGPSSASIYSSMVQVPAASSLYASQIAAPSIYASMPAAPMVGASLPEARSSDNDFPALPEGYCTVGLMLWPGKNGELLVTGFMEGHSAENCGLEAGDIVIAVDDNSVEGMSAADAAARMAGPTGSSVTVTTSRTADDDQKTTHTAVIVRDVSSGEANKKTQESLESTGIANKQQERQMTAQECMQYGVPFGSTWGRAPSKAKASVRKAAPAPAPAKPAPKPAAKYRTPMQSTAIPEGGRMLSHQECMQYGVPYGSRISAPKPKAA